MKATKPTANVSSSNQGNKRAPGAPPPNRNAQRAGPNRGGGQGGSRTAAGQGGPKGAQATGRKSSQTSMGSEEGAVPLTKEGKLKREILRGRLDVECPPNAKVVRIFTSSTFTDSSVERNALMSRVYPKLKAFCQEAGYEFQIVDMRWGVRDEATDNHMTSDLCLREIKQCQRLSTGPNFVTFLSHKYGYQAFPSKIDAKEFEKLFAKITDKDDRKFIEKWLKRDDNSVPPCYTLQPISTHLPDFISEDEEKRKAARSVWHEEGGRVKQALAKVAESALTLKERNKYMISVTEAEINAGVMESEDVGKHCLWFRRVITDIDQQQPSPALEKFIDFSADEAIQTRKRSLLKELSIKKLPGVLPAGQIHTHEVTWTDRGIDPEREPTHQQYVDAVCADFETTVTAMITAGIAEREQHAVTDHLYNEVLQHSLFAQAKCRSFHGREDMLESIKAYVLGNAKMPLVIHGPSGSGKTSVMAKAGMMSRSWLETKGKCAVLLRFLGTTPDSTGISQLLTSLLRQLMAIAKYTEELPTELKQMVALFAKLLGALPTNFHLVIFLDSLDQLDPSNGARHLSWLPKHLPAVVKIIVSTLPEPMYGCFPRLQAMVKDQKQFLSVQRLPDTDVSKILDSWLVLGNRTLTAGQKTIVLEKFQECPIPLFLKLSFDEACRWKSYDPPDTTVLETTVRAAINKLFERVEHLHGKLLVSRALTLLTLSVSGLTESELEDILSCDEEVLNDVYQYWLPPVRRLPPLLVVRIKADLAEYLVDRGADEVRVFYWYHRQFIETATARYCQDPEVNAKGHALLAHFFRGTWAGVAKPYTDGSGSEGEADRFVAAQPLQFGKTPNIRKLNNLPYHLIRGGLLDLVKEDVCLNMEFLLAKVKASSLRSVLDDFEDATKILPKDEDINLVLEALRLSQDALRYDPHELPCQLLCRLPPEKDNIFGDLSNLPIQYLMPDTKILTPPGGQLIHCLAGHRESINCVDVSSDGQIAVTASADKSVRFWDVRAGKMIQALEHVVEDPERAQICAQDTVAVVNSDTGITGFRIPSGDTVYKIDNIESENSEMNFVACGKDRSTLAIFGDRTVYIYDAVTGARRSMITNTADMKDDTFGPYDPVSARGRYVATATNGSAIMRIIDVQKAEFIHNKRVFPAPKTDEDDELEIDAVVIAPDRKTVLFSNYMDNDVHICHLKTMARLRVLKGKDSDSAEKFHISLDGSTLFFPNHQSMGVVDLKTGLRRNQIKHPNNLVDVATVDMVHVVTVSGDSVVRIWDLSREDPLTKPKPAGEQTRAKSARKQRAKGQEAESPPATSEEDTKERKFGFRNILTLPNPGYAMVTNRQSEIQIYDLLKKTNVRSAKVDPGESVSWTVFDTKTAVAVTSTRQIQIVDLNQMAAVRVLQGFLPKYNTEMGIRRQAREIVTLTRGRKNVKIHNVDSGLTTDILRSDQDKCIEDLLISKNEKWLAALVDEGPLLIFDLEERKCRHRLDKKTIGEYPSLSESLFTPCGTYLLLSVSQPFPGHPDIDEQYFLVFSTETGDPVQHLLDVEYYRKYQDSDVNHGVYPGCTAYLRDFLFLVGSDDKIIRVWNVKTGELQRRLTGHSHDVSTLLSAEDGSRFVSYSSYTEEEAFRLWDGHTFTCLATFKADDDIARINLTVDGRQVVAGSAAKKTVVVWQLMEAGKPVDACSREEEFEGQQTALTFTPLGMKTYPEEDPDTEAQEVSSDEEDSADSDDLSQQLDELAAFSDLSDLSDDDDKDGKKEKEKRQAGFI